MEAKGHSVKDPSAKEVARGGESAAEGAVAAQKNVVARFVEYAYKVINENMDDFFEDNMEVFDQDDEDVESGRGETFEQYEVFKKYLEEVAPVSYMSGYCCVPDSDRGVLYIFLG